MVACYEAIENWRYGRPGNEAGRAEGDMIMTILERCPDELEQSANNPTAWFSNQCHSRIEYYLCCRGSNLGNYTVTQLTVGI